MLVPGRYSTANDYRYGFNGMEKDNEVKGEGNSYDFGARIYDPRIGRWFKTDILSTKYPYDSPFIFSGDSPISIMDPDGKRKRKITLIYNEQGVLVGTQVKVVDHSFIKKATYSRSKLEIAGIEIYNDQVINYDYYDSVDIEVAVRDKTGKIFGNIDNNSRGSSGTRQ